jgi:hypothetical protein
MTLTNGQGVQSLAVSSFQKLQRFGLDLVVFCVDKPSVEFEPAGHKTGSLAVIKRNAAILELTATRMELAVVRGGVVIAQRAERYNPAESGADLVEVLRPRHATLKQWVSELDVEGISTTVLIASSTTRCGVFSCASAAGPAAVTRAAGLALGEIAGYSTVDQPTDLEVVCKDKIAITRPNVPAAQQQSHVLGVVDTESNCQLIAGWTSSCGLVPARIVPTMAHAIAQTIEAVTAKTSTLQARFYLGEHDSFLVAADSHGIRFFRLLSAGVESLVEAMTREIRVQGSTEPVVLDRAAARSILAKFGIPAPTTMIDQRQGVTGASILPLISPILQRVAVEIKQSLRFGLSEADRNTITLSVGGYGSAISNFAKTIATASGVTLAQDGQSFGDCSTLTSAAHGTILSTVEMPGLGISLLPASMQQARLVRTGKRYMYGGIAVACAIVAYHAGYGQLSLWTTQSAAQALMSNAQEAQRLDEQNKATTAAVQASAKASTMLAQSIGPTTDFAAVLSAIASLANEHTTFSNVEVKDEQGALIVRLPTIMQVEDEAVFAQYVHSLLTRAKALPIVTNVKLGSTSRSESNGRAVQQFDLTLTLIALPADQVGSLAPRSVEAGATELRASVPEVKP